MKTLLALAAVIALAGCTSGCTSVTSPSGWSYHNFGFQKQFSELTASTNGTITVKGYKSDAESLVKAAAEGAAAGAFGRPAN